VSTAAKRTYLSPEDYLALELRAEIKSEYYDGSTFVMSGASRRHHLIAVNFIGEFRTRLRGRPCEVYGSDMRVAVGRGGPYTYPDVVALRGEPQFLDAEFDTLLNPSLIVEALSPSTEAHDRGDKFARYRRIASLREYVLASQDRMLVERFERRGEQWVLTEWGDPDGVLTPGSIDGAVPLRGIYERASFSGDD
jgi:Uma2 family endonuclease